MSIFNGMPSQRKQMKWAHQERMAALKANADLDINMVHPARGGFSQYNMFQQPTSQSPQMGIPGMPNPMMLPPTNQPLPFGNFAQTGGSIVDYLKSQGRGASKAERKELALSRGLKGDFSAEDNLALLSLIQKDGVDTNVQYPQTEQVTPMRSPIANRMAPVQDIDPNTGQPMEMMINSPQILDMVRPEASVVNSPVASRTRPVRTAPRRASAPSKPKSDNDIFAADAAKRIAMYAKQGPSTTPVSKTLPTVVVNSYTKKIPNYSRTGMPGDGGTTSKIDFNALRKIQQAFKERKGKVITSSGERKEFSTLTDSERRKLSAELSKYERYYSF